MRTALILLAMLATPVLASQVVWKWVDEQGVTHYSDRPVPGATRMELSGGTTRGPAAAPTAATPATPGAPRTPAAASQGYQDFEFLRPTNQDTIPNSGGTVSVALRLVPALQSGHAVSLYLDGRLVEDAESGALEYTLQNVSRGTHTLLAIIEDLRGRQIQRTDTVTFFIRQESIAQPPVGPALRPPPKPQPRTGANQKLPTSQPSVAALNGSRAPIDPATNAPRVPPPRPAGPRTGN